MPAAHALSSPCVENSLRVPGDLGQVGPESTQRPRTKTRREGELRDARHDAENDGALGVVGGETEEGCEALKIEAYAPAPKVVHRGAVPDSAVDVQLEVYANEIEAIVPLERQGVPFACTVRQMSR